MPNSGEPLKTQKNTKNMFIKAIQSFIFICFVVISLSGCGIFKGGAETAAKTPIFGIHYYPYTVSKVRTTATPEPNFKDWTNERMVRDLDKMQKAGIDIVIVSMNPEEIEDKGRIAKYMEFIKLAGSNPEYPKVAFMAECYKATKQQLQNFVKWCEDVGLDKMSGYFKFKGKSLVEIYEGLKDRYIKSDKLTIRHTVWCQEWYWGVAKSAETTEMSRNGEQAMVFAGFLTNGNIGPKAGWKLERKDGETLRKRMRAAVKLNPEIICIASWNDFWEGHFIEPNSLDGDKLYNVLCEEIKEVKK